MRDGDILQGRFRLDRQIGRGGFARVFLCTDLTLGRQVAIKVLNPELLERHHEHDFLTRFRREARAVAGLDHPNILGIYDYGEDAGAVYLVMPYVEGGTLYNRLAGGRALDLAATGTYLRQVAAALDYAHRRGIVHRDIKPQNMLLRAEDDRLLLADFGIAKVIGDTGAQTQTGAVGTIAYMSPEQFRGQISPALDIYALGCVLFQLLTGRVPFGGSTEQVIFGHISTPVPSLAELSGGRVPATLQAVVERALRKDPAERYATASDLSLAFDRALNDDEATRLPPPLLEMDTIIAPAPKPGTNRPTTASRTPPPYDSTRFAPPPISSPQPSTGGPGTFPPPPSSAHYTPTPLGAGDSSPAPLSAPIGGIPTGPNSASAVPFPTPASPPRHRSRLPLFAVVGVVLLLLLTVGGVALQRRTGDVTPQATVGNTLVAVAATATTAATHNAPTATVPVANTAGVTPSVPTPTTQALGGTGVPVLPATPPTVAGTTAPVLPPTVPPTMPPTATATARTATPAPALAPLKGTVAVTFTGHTDHLRGLTWTADGKTLVSGAGDGTVRIWRTDGTLAGTVSGRTFAVTSVAISPDGTLLAVGADGSANQAQIWRTDGSNSPVATLTGHTNNVTMVAWSPDGKTLATSSSDRTVRFWTAAGQPLRTLNGHTDIVQNIAWAADGQSLVSASWDKSLRIWGIDGTLLKTLAGHTDQVFGVAWSPDGKLIASASRDKSIKLWRPDGSLVATLTGHTQPVSSVAWSPDGRTLASGSFDSTVRLWSAAGAPLATFTGHTDAVTALAWLPDGSGLASGSWDKTSKLWR